MTPPLSATNTADVVIARPGELWLKGKNRGLFERVLIENIRAAVAPLTRVRVSHDDGQLTITPERRPYEVALRIQDVFGLASVAPAWSCAREADEIVRAARDVLAEALEARPRDRRIAFRVSSRRADKRFPMISTELDRYVADRIMPEFVDRLRVDLRAPELTVSISVRAERAFVFAERLPGAGGLPVGTVGSALCLLSGGIDSPVAAWLTMKRGCDVPFVSFHSYPYLGERSREKIRELVRALGRYQRRSVLFSVPFTEVQTRIRDACAEPYRTVLYRRMMQRIATRIAAREGALALVTGESLGQVASQTLENLTCIGAASDLPVLRPLISFDKQETITLARRIGTFDVSVRPEPDCCTVFQPERPVIRGTLARCAREEAALDVEGLVTAAVEGTEREEL